MITISTNNIVKSQLAKIDGYTYRVRRFGSGEYLDISRLSREIQKLSTKITEAQKSPSVKPDEFNAILDDFEKLQDKLLSKVAAAMEPIDGGDARAVANSMSIDDFMGMINHIFELADKNAAQSEEPKDGK